MKRYSLTLFVVALFGFVAVVPAFTQAQDKTLAPAGSHASETLAMWNEIGNKLVAMAQDFPEDKYDYKLQKDQRTFAENILHVAAFDLLMATKLSGSQVGPDFGKNGDNPPRSNYKTKADVVKLMQLAVSEGARVIQQQGDAGLDKTTSWGKRLVHASYIWNFASEHSGEHYGQLVVYYRAQNLVPPASRQ